MTVSSVHQMNVFLICIAAGIICGAFFDFERSIRRIYGSKNSSVAMHDVVFTAVCIIIMIWAGTYFNNGELRYYQILGALCGALLYASLLSSAFMWVFCTAHKIFIKLILKPVFILLKKISGGVRIAFSFILKFYKKITKKCLNFVKKSAGRIKNLKKRIKML